MVTGSVLDLYLAKHCDFVNIFGNSFCNFGKPLGWLVELVSKYTRFNLTDLYLDLYSMKHLDFGNILEKPKSKWSV